MKPWVQDIQSRDMIVPGFPPPGRSGVAAQIQPQVGAQLSGSLKKDLKRNIKGIDYSPNSYLSHILLSLNQITQI